MYNKSQISEAFRGMIGVRPTMDWGNVRARLDENITKSTQDIWVNDIHKMFRVENFVDAMDNFHWFEPKPYSALDTHYKTDVVKDLNGDIYECLQSTSSEPLSNPAYWLKTTMMSVRFREIIDSSVHDTISDLIEMKKYGMYGRTLKGVTSLYSGSGVRSNTVKKSGRFVGYYIKVKESGVIVKLNRMGLQLTNSVNVPIYIYDSQQIIEKAQWTFNFGSPGKFSYADIPNNQVMNDHEGYYVIGYYEDDLPDGVDAIQIYNSIFKASSGCGSCNSSDLQQRSQWSTFIEVVPVAIKGANKIDGMVWGVEDMEMLDDTNFGMNLALTFTCDMTKLFIDQKESFMPAVTAKVAIKLFEELAYKRRNNAPADENQNLAYAIMWNDNTKNLSPEQVYTMRLHGLDFEFSGINSRCLPERFDGSIAWGVA